MPSLAPSQRSLRNRFRSTPRTPVQDRSIEKVERILDAAEGLVEEIGVTNLTMTMISEKSGVGRGTVYQFFPSVLAVWKGLALRYLAALEAAFEATVLQRAFTDWNDAWDALVDAAVEYYNRNPAGQKILLGSAEGHDLRTADAEWDRRYAEWIRANFIHLAEDARMFDVAFLRVMVTATTANFSLSVSEHGRITQFYAEQAKKMSKAYTAQLRSDFLGEQRA